jgi:hypothetical protein
VAHKDKQPDVEAAMQRYRDLTGDGDAQLTRVDVTSKFVNAFGEDREKTIARYNVVNSEGLRGFEAFGHTVAKWGLTLYCNGVEDERRRQRRAEDGGRTRQKNA